MNEPSNYQPVVYDLPKSEPGGIDGGRKKNSVVGLILLVAGFLALTLATLRGELTWARVTKVDDLRDLDPDLSELVGDRERVVVRAEHDRALAGLDREVANQAPHAVGEHHADEVVPGEDERLLGGAGRDDDPLRAEAVQNRAGVDRDEPALPDPESARGRKHLDAVERQIAQSRVLVHEDDAGTVRWPPRARRRGPLRRRRRRARARGDARCRSAGSARRAGRASRGRPRSRRNFS